jgi:hypothetical protein
MQTSFADILPPDALHLVRTRVTAEFATISSAGVPIDTPVFFFASPDLATLDIGTGVSYPAKAERARRNAKVGMLIEGEKDEPVIAIAGHAAVRDADIQANAERYLAETIFSPNVDPRLIPWENTRRRLYYCARIIVAVAPVHVRWWPNRAAMDERPSEWRAAEGTVFPQSDPPPHGKPSAAPAWRQEAWRALAEQAVASTMPAHLTLLDDNGYPVPIRVGEYALDDAGFRLRVPRGAPWREGKASLSFVGKEILLGEVQAEGADLFMRVDRALPVLPMMDSRTGLSDTVLDTLNARLAEEMQRRGQPLPVVPEEPPAPTEGALLRARAAEALDNNSVGAGIAR